MMQQSERGISLIEVIITVGLFLIVGAALVQLGVVALTSSDNSRSRAAALQLADEGLEIARVVRDTDADSFFSMSGNKAVNETLDGLIDTNCDPLVDPFVPAVTNPCTVAVNLSGTDVNYYRVVRVSDTVGLTNAKDITVYVFWNNRGSFSNAVSGTILSRWQN